MTERFVIGLAGAPFGLKGHVKIKSLSGETGHLLALQSALIRQGGRERTLRIEESAAQGSVVLCKFAGFDSPEEAKALAGAELLAAREQASPLGPGEFYVEDLRGLAVEAADNGDPLGRITDVVEGGGGELAEIQLPGGERKLVPFRKEFFAEISPEKGRAALLNRWILE